MWTIKDAAEEICAAGCADSGYILKMYDVISAIRSDGGIPTKQECSDIVMGTDGNGQVPTELEKRFPSLNKLIEDQF